ncbi:CTD nuclear envelope phosphatase 1-like protein [Sesbania bispinosa]|nr:CTD nuclear envelope phosphatase 1-like protein [Sesbania bispinosa]
MLPSFASFFKPLPSVELREHDSPSPPSAVEITVVDCSFVDHRPVQKLTVLSQ